MESPDFFCRYLLSRNPGLRQPQFYNELLNVTKMIQGVMTSGCVWPNIFQALPSDVWTQEITALPGWTTLDFHLVTLREAVKNVLADFVL